MVAASGAVRTQVGFIYRFGTAVRRWEELDTGRVGLFVGRFHCRALHAPWWRQRGLSGGQMVEQLIHLIVLVRATMGEPTSVYARAANLFHREGPAYTGEGVSAVIFAFADGRLATLNAAQRRRARPLGQGVAPRRRAHDRAVQRLEPCDPDQHEGRPPARSGSRPTRTCSWPSPPTSRPPSARAGPRARR